MIDIDTEAIRRLRDHFLHPQVDAEVCSDEQRSQATPALRQAVLRRAEPFAETLYLVMQADNHAAAEEQRILRGALRILTEGWVDDESLDALQQEFAIRLAQQGAAARVQQLGTRLSTHAQDREMAFSLAAAVALADASVEVSEHALLQQMAEDYGISARRMAILLGALD